MRERPSIAQVLKWVLTIPFARKTGKGLDEYRCRYSPQLLLHATVWRHDPALMRPCVEAAVS